TPPKQELKRKSAQKKVQEMAGYTRYKRTFSTAHTQDWPGSWDCLQPKNHCRNVGTLSSRGELTCQSVFSTKDRFACVWKVFSTKDRFACVWVVFSTNGRFACVWMVFSTKARFAYAWKVFSTMDWFACEHMWKVFRTKVRFACVWKVFSTKDRFACVWMVFSTKDRCVCLCVEGVQHQGQVFSTKDRCVCLWVDGVQHQGQVFSTKDRFACGWMVFSTGTKDRFACGWMVFSTDMFACVGKVFSTKDRFACVGKVFSTKDRFACVGKVFSTKDRFTCVWKVPKPLKKQKFAHENGRARRGEGVVDACMTPKRSKVAADCSSIEDYCLDLTREDWTRSGDLETQEEDDNNNIHRLDETADFEVEDRVKSLYRLDCSRRKNQTFVGKVACKKMGRTLPTKVWFFLLLQSSLRVHNLKTEEQKSLY
ncbi:hypothetical protein Bbelb_066640, partial [Branchiostoma belcheri]